MKQFVFSFVLLGLFACNNHADLDKFMVDVSEFTIDTTLLKDGDYVEILGASDKLTPEHEIDFYTLVVVRSKETGDTINVLTTNYYVPYLNNPETRFISNTSQMGKILENSKELSNLEGKNINSLQSKSFKKVFYDTDWIDLDVKGYPAVIGNLGEYTIEEGNINE